MKVSKRTEKLIREAAVLAFVHGANWGRYGREDEPHPKDSAVVFELMHAAKEFSDLYPNLSKVEPQTPWLLPPGREGLNG